jgi:hypothetical protein
MGYRHYGVNTGGIPINYIRLFSSHYNIPVFIETGTAGGDSIREAALIFPICHTIEIVEGRADGSYPDNVTLHSGDSAKILNSIAENYKGHKVFFWLDAHWSEPVASEGDTQECPVMQEIDAIYHAGHKEPFIMIDDARLFLGPPPWPCDPRKWPSIKGIFERLTSCWPDSIVTMIDDYIVCFPNYTQAIFMDEWRGRFEERYPTEEKKVQLAAKKAWEHFVNYIK